MTDLVMPKRGIGVNLSREGHNFLAEVTRRLNVARSGGGGGGFTVFDEPVFIEAPNDDEYRIVVNRSFAGTINSIATRTRSGTCRVTTLVNGTPVGTWNDASASLQVQAVDADFDVGAEWSLALTLVAATRGLSVTIGYTRT